jgi:hypothetical protein
VTVIDSSIAMIALGMFVAMSYLAIALWGTSQYLR